MGTLNENLFVQGSLSASSFTAPSGSITNDAIKAAAKIDASKLEGEFSLSHDQTGAVVAATKYLRVIRGTTGSLLALQAAITEAVATGADRTVTIDLKKSTGGAAFASVLSSTLVFDNTAVLRDVVDATISDADLVVGDILQLTVAVAGAAGAQANGLIVTLTLNEDAN